MNVKKLVKTQETKKNKYDIHQIEFIKNKIVGAGLPVMG